jgi:hypothetical protein
MLLEVLRKEYFEQRFRDLRELLNLPDHQEVESLPFPPELLTLAELRLRGKTAKIYVYLDRPLGEM